MAKEAKRSGRYSWESVELDEIEELEKENGVAVFSDMEVELFNTMLRRLKEDDEEYEEFLRKMKENGDDF